MTSFFSIVVVFKNAFILVVLFLLLVFHFPGQLVIEKVVSFNSTQTRKAHYKSYIETGIY